jgi:hypothetical protein
MPNHVTNKIVARGPLSRVEALLAQARVTVHSPGSEVARMTIPAKTEKLDLTEELDFSLRGFVPPPDHPDYGAGGCSHRHGFTGSEGDEHPNCWYVWNRKNWGTKWDCYDVRIEQDTETVLESMARLDAAEQYGGTVIYFDTAWCPPGPVIEKIVELYPDLEIEFTFMDEDMTGGGGGRWVYRQGAQVEGRDGINDRADPEFVRIATDLKGYDPADYDDE